jgi:spoIIIJ-associated protein
VSAEERRFFSASSLALAVATAARWYGVEPERLAYRVREKRHGFVKAPRGVVIEVEPSAPERVGEAEPPPPVESSPPAPAEPVAPRSTGGARSRGRGPERPRGEARGARRPERHADSEGWSAPDAESELAAREACSRLLRFAGLALLPEVTRTGERLEVRLSGADEAELARRGVALLDDLEHLLPRAVHGLCGRMVRVRVEGAGLRGARERELVELAEAAAARVLAGGPAEMLEPLPPAERRIVHLALVERAGVATESLGDGYQKRLRIFAAES